MRRKIFLISAFMLCLPTATLQAAGKGDADAGQRPDWETYKQIGTAALKASLIDPESARIEWPYVAVSGTLKAFLGKKRSGFFTCGLVNAKNRMGGYTGSAFFLIMIKNNQVVSLDIGQAGQIDTASASCPDYIKKGVFPVAANLAANVPAPAQAEPSLGLIIRAVPEGAYVSRVGAGTAAERAGLIPGMVISAINNVQLRGFDDAAIIRVFEASQGGLSLSIVGRSDVVLLAQ
jgi:PDZ domain